MTSCPAGFFTRRASDTPIVGARTDNLAPATEIRGLAQGLIGPILRVGKEAPGQAISTSDAAREPIPAICASATLLPPAADPSPSTSCSRSARSRPSRAAVRHPQHRRPPPGNHRPDRPRGRTTRPAHTPAEAPGNHPVRPVRTIPGSRPIRRGWANRPVPIASDGAVRSSCHGKSCTPGAGCRSGRTLPSPGEAPHRVADHEHDTTDPPVMADISPMSLLSGSAVLPTVPRAPSRARVQSPENSARTGSSRRRAPRTPGAPGKC